MSGDNELQIPVRIRATGRTMGTMGTMGTIRPEPWGRS
jgi:hypothetical protein